jgi:two-component system sensor histidine kinase UhpB
MTLRLKINLIVGALTLLFLVGVLGLQWRNMRDSVHEEVEAATRVAAQLLGRTAWRHATQDTSAMLAFLKDLGRVRSNDITLYDVDGHELYRSPASPYKAGRDAPAWFAALISPPPSERTILYPDGRLSLRSNASRAVLDAWDDVIWLLGGSLLTLLLVNLLVFWLVGRTTRPFGKIVGALEQLQAGRFDVALPPLPGREAAAIGVAFNRMVSQLKTHIDTERRAVQAEVQLSDSRELTRWIDRHVEQERRLIARELHDELSQSVTAMRSMALSIARRVGPFDPEAEGAARVIADESSRLYDAMHGMIPRLTPMVLDNFGLGEALEDLAERTRRSHPGVEIELQVSPGDAALPAEVSLALYRAAQEGFTNALRHGKARRLSLRVSADGPEVSLALRDDGCGLPTGGLPRGAHYGLRWLAERVEGLHGRLQVDNVAPRGVLLQVGVPLPVEAR